MRYEEVKELIQIFEANKDLTELELTMDNLELRLNRGETKQPVAMPMFGMPPAPPLQPTSQAPAPSSVAGQQTTTVEQPTESATTPEEAPAASQGGNFVKAPIVGTFYQSASPDKPAFVKVGDKVAKGDVICIIEAMKFMNEIQSEYDGTIAEILVDNEEFVEYGQELFRIV